MQPFVRFDRYPPGHTDLANRTLPASHGKRFQFIALGPVRPDYRALSHHADDRIEDDDGQDGTAVQPLAQDEGEHRRDDEDDHQELAELV